MKKYCNSSQDTPVTGIVNMFESINDLKSEVTHLECDTVDTVGCSIETHVFLIIQYTTQTDIIPVLCW